MRIVPLLPIAAGVTVFTLSWALVLLVRSLALRRGLLDLPNERSSHVLPTPRLGGIGILVAIVVAGSGMAWAAGMLSRDAVIVLVLSAGVSLVSLQDDLRGLSPLGRLIVHLAAAFVTVAALGALDIVPGVEAGTAATLAAQGLTILWIAGFINAFNFMDGTDGIAAAQALIAGSVWAVTGWSLDDAPLMVVAIAVAAASAGFLVHNRPPATIFMGDVGSALLGFLLSTLPLLAVGRQSLLTAVLPVWPFVFDTTFTLLRRARRRENLLAAHRSHLYQRLTRCGWSHGRTAILYSVLALAGASVTVPMAVGRLHSVLPALIVLVVGPALLWMLVVSQEARHAGSAFEGMPARRSDDA
ncbi:MAG TPA: glycosyltransferase family 4 protein [Vicinamibacterales bacterium]|nr:glycosyltransferase family 4 protein [Vicinamibacterales bacterium]